MADVGAVGKSKKNVQQGYQFRGVDDVVAHVQDVMAARGVVCVPRVVEREREMVDTKSGGKMASVRLLVEHTFFAADGSSVTCTTLGEAMDSGDKASNKAMSAALKYALTETLLIPTYEVDRDTEEHSPQFAPKTPPSKPVLPPAPASKPSPPSNVTPINDPSKSWEVRIFEAPTMDALMAIGRELAQQPKHVQESVRSLFTARHAQMGARK